jgi:hypothetical protein
MPALLWRTQPARGWRALIPLALFFVSACSQATPAYTGAQLRTPVDKIPSGGQMQGFQLVGHNPLVESRFNLPRGQNGGGMTAIRDCLYVGSNNSKQPALILDMKDMTKPTIVGDLPGIHDKAMGTESIESVADLNLLVPITRTYPQAGTEVDLKLIDPKDRKVGLVILDATDCRKPTITAKVDVPNDSLHYLTLWRDPDPSRSTRVLAYVTFARLPTDKTDLRVYDLTGCPKTCDPKMIAEWSASQQFGIPQNDTSAYEGGQWNKWNETHDVTPTLDGTRIHVGARHFGYIQLDSTPLAKNLPCNPARPESPDPSVASVVKASAGHCLKALNPDMNDRMTPWGTLSAHIHGVVKVPGRPYAVVTNEALGGCPYGGIQLAYIGTTDNYGPGAPAKGLVRGDLRPRQVGAYSIPEDQADHCGPDGTPDPSFGLAGDPSLHVHNVLVFPNIVFAGWNGGGIRAVDISNPYFPFEVGYFFNKPVAEVRWCTGGGGCATTEVDGEGIPVRTRATGPLELAARSYPISMNGHIVYADSVSGVYVLKYTGPHANEIPQQGNCLSHNPNNVKVGFEPCAPYNDKTSAPSK